MRLNYLFLTVALLIAAITNGQDPKRFQKDIDVIDVKNGKTTNSHELIVFTGSSSIVGWKNVKDYFPGKNIINTGFGGSQMCDLLYYSDSVIIKYKPEQVFIYEGDNDVAAGKKTEAVIKDAEALIKRITDKVAGIQIVIISVKPSPSRWKLKDEYLKLNDGYKNLSSKYKNVRFIDVWYPLLNDQGTPKKEIFGSDSLHINKLGYEIWAREIKKFIK
jgi:lysophospholipase L1-like esterase